MTLSLSLSNNCETRVESSRELRNVRFSGHTIIVERRADQWIISYWSDAIGWYRVCELSRRRHRLCRVAAERSSLGGASDSISWAQRWMRLTARLASRPHRSPDQTVSGPESLNMFTPRGAERRVAERSLIFGERKREINRKRERD